MSNDFRDPEMPGRPTREKPPGIRIWEKPTGEQKKLRQFARERDKTGLRRFIPRAIRRHVPQKIK